MLDGALDRGFDTLVRPPFIHGTARLASLAYQGRSLASLLDLIGPLPATLDHPMADRAAWLLDRSLAYALNFRAAEAAALQAEALSLSRVFRIYTTGGGYGLHLLVLMAAGDLMVNAPLDCLLAATGVQLTLMFVDPDAPLPARLPEHDVAIVAASENAPAVLALLAQRFDAWPRPILNDPRRIQPLCRDGVAARLGGLPGMVGAATVQADRDALLAHGVLLLPDGRFPVLLRPLLSHAGNGLMKCDSPADIARFLAMTPGDRFYLSQFIDYRGPEGWFRKYRVAFIEGRPFLCHMAASEHWMVHYLNAGMAESAAKRAAEAAAMAEFDTGFAHRHRQAFAALASEIGLHYFSIDCTQAPDGRLLVFEVDVAAIIHCMDPPALYPYKLAPMQRCADAFAAMLARRC